VRGVASTGLDRALLEQAPMRSSGLWFCMAAAALVACGSDSTSSPMERDAGVPDIGSSEAGAVAPPASEAGSSDAGSPPSGDAGVPILGGPGCGFAAAAFCDTFDAPSSFKGRAGELDARWWSGSRLAPQGPTAPGQAFGIGPATLMPTRTTDGGTQQLPPCRPGLPEQVSPDGDTLVCDANADIASPHLLVAVAAQNYGENSYRIRQPFDFAGRTGKVAFDAEALGGGLLGWVSIEVTDEPIPVPGFSLGQKPMSPYPNDEGTILPKNGFEVQLNGGGPGGGVLSLLALFSNYVESDTGSNLVPIDTRWGKLNHFEVDVSQQKIDVYASPASADGVTFAPPQLVFSEAVNLQFTRGYVHITTHNHATIKYSAPGSDFGDGFTNLDSWIARWDNVGFDGPVVQGWREYEVRDPLTSGQLSLYNGTPTQGLNTGWTVPDVDAGKTALLHFQGVDLAGMTTARISLASWYCLGCSSPVATFTLKYRLNGNVWHDRPLNPGELAYLTGGAAQGALGQMLDVPIGELAQGDNTLEFTSENVPQNYPPGVVNVDLVLGAN
jgi:hypothetical protein